MGGKSIQPGTAIALPIPVPATQLFSHRATNALLALLADNPHALFGVRDLARATDYTHKTISDAVVDLAAADLVETSHEGPKKLVQINRARLDNPDDPILRIPQSEFHEPVSALLDRLHENLEDIRGIVLFGSVACGEADRRSDIDCFVLVADHQATNQQRAHELTSDLSERRFSGDRYKFHLLVESLESTQNYGERLRDIFATGLTLAESESLRTLKQEVLANGR